MAGDKAKAKAFDPDRRMAATPDELEGVFARGAYGPIASLLDYAPYFPRSARTAQRDAGLMGASMLLLAFIAGCWIGSGLVSLQTRNVLFLAAGSISGLLMLRLVRLMSRATLAARTAERCKFIELAAFGEMRGVPYLRRFGSENPALETRRAGKVIQSGPRQEPLENLIDTFLGTFGPAVGLGHPGEHRIDDRIFRVYVRREEWQDVVNALLADAPIAFVHYEASEHLAWELGQALAAPDRVVVVLLTGVPEDAMDDEPTAIRALPEALRAGGRPVKFEAFRRQDYLGGAPALLAVVEKDSLQLFGTKLHSSAVFDVMLKAIVRVRSRRAPPRAKLELPRAYSTFARAVSSQERHGGVAILAQLMLAIIGAGATWYALHRLV